MLTLQTEETMTGDATGLCYNFSLLRQNAGIVSTYWCVERADQGYLLSLPLPACHTGKDLFV